MNIEIWAKKFIFEKMGDVEFLLDNEDETIVTAYQNNDDKICINIKVSDNYHSAKMTLVLDNESALALGKSLILLNELQK